MVTSMQMWEIFQMTDSLSDSLHLVVNNIQCCLGCWVLYPYDDRSIGTVEIGLKVAG